MKPLETSLRKIEPNNQSSKFQIKVWLTVYVNRSIGSVQKECNEMQEILKKSEISS
uniref:Uncharacterized protein n=1 Tax=Tetranychus urticae TaxID=32264 RepID=T1KS11_TETUR